MALFHNGKHDSEKSEKLFVVDENIVSIQNFDKNTCSNATISCIQSALLFNIMMQKDGKERSDVD